MRRLVGLAMTIAVLVAAAGPASAVSATWTAWPASGNGPSLAAVTGTSDADVWAVGLRIGGQCQYQTLAEHWDGSSWSVSPTVDVSGRGTVLADVAAITPSDAWAVGTTSCPTVQPTRTLTEHWNGSSWSIVPSPNPSAEFSSLAGVTAISASNVWAVGSRIDTGVGGPLVEHWNGSSWIVVPSPTATGADELVAISASGPSDVWAVGSGPSGNSDQPLAMRWNGRRWRFAPVPTPGGAHGLLSDVVAVAPGDAWAVGGYRPGGGSTLQPLIVHWDGTAWTPQSAPNLGGFATLESIARSPSGQLVAAGFSVDLVRSRAVMIARTQTGWTTVTPPPTDDLFDLTLPGSAAWGVSGSTLLRGEPG